MITTRWWTVWWNSLHKFWTPPGILLIICPQWSCLFMTLKIMNIILLIWARVIITLLKDISLKEKYQIQYELHLRWTSTKYNMWIWFMLAVLEASKVFFSDQKIGPSRLHNSQSCSFFSLGSKRTNDRAWDDKEMARITHAAWYAAKNTSNILAVAVGWGTAEAVKQGGEWECVQKTMNGGCVHHQRGRMWVTNENSHKLLGFAFRVAAESPLD